MIATAAGRIATILLSLLVFYGRLTADAQCFDAESSFQKQGCVCNYVDKRATISCTFLHGELPTSMSQSYSYVKGLTIYRGTLTSLKRSNFIFFPSLTQLAIQNTALQHIDHDAFEDTNLLFLTLEDSRLTEFPPVSNLRQLVTLSVKGNHISSITKANLLNTTSLMDLDLGSNQITELPVDVFDNTCKLKKLSLSNNGIKEFRFGTFNQTDINYLDLSFTQVEQLPIDGIRNYLQEINLKGATHFILPPFTENDASHGNLTYPLLNKITMPFHTYCCRLRSQRIKPLQIAASKKRQGSLPQPTPSPSTSLQAVISTSSLVSDCTTSTVLQTTCRTWAAKLDPTVAVVQSSISATLMTFSVLDKVMVISAIPTPSPTTTSFSSKASCSNPLTASDVECVQSALSFVPIATSPLPTEVVSYVSDTPGTQDFAQSTDSVSFITTVVSSSSLIQPIVTISSVNDMSTAPTSQNSAIGTDLSFMGTSFLPTNVLSATPVVSCYTETVVMLCCNRKPIDCSAMCTTDFDPITCLECYNNDCLDASTCSFTAACVCAAEQNSGNGSVCTTVNSSETSSSTVLSATVTPLTPIQIKSCVERVLNYERTNAYIECLPAEDPFNPCEELLSEGIRAVIWIVITVTLLGNGTVVTCMTAYWLFFRRKQKQLQVVNFLYLNLAAADFLMGVYLFTIGTEDLRTHYDSPGAFFTQSVTWQSSSGCNFAGFCVMTSISMSVFTLVLITLERVHNIVQVFQRKKMSMKVAAILVGAGWAFAAVVGGLPIAQVSSYGKTAVCLPLDSSSTVSAGYVYFVLVATGVSSLVIATSYIVIGCNVFCNRQKGYPANASKMSECYVAIRMSVIVLTNFACWFPIAVVALGSASGQHWIGLDDAKVFMVVVLPLNASLNPIIYTLSTRMFRDTLVMMGKKYRLMDFFRHASHRPQSREASTLRRLSLTKTSTTDLFSSSGSKSNLSPGDPADVEETAGTPGRGKTLCTTNMASLASIREDNECEDPPGLVIRNDVAARARGSEQYESVLESITTETSFSGIIENRARVEE